MNIVVSLSVLSHSIIVSKKHDMIYTSVTQKLQATIPREIRKYLHLQQGDRLRFELIEGKVVVKKLTPLDIEFAKTIESSLNEWMSAEDEEAYREL